VDKFLSFFYPNKEMKYMVEWLLLCGVVLIAIWFYRKSVKHTEGFQQKERFVLKTDGATYDGFYSEIYDELMVPETRAKYEADIILQTLQPESRFSCMLDVGSGTGAFLNELETRGFEVQGIDTSKPMCNKAIAKYPKLVIKNESVLDPMAYNRAAFTHIFCMDFTLYEIADKAQFFKNCYYWLQNNGYLVVHLADKERFNGIIPAAKPPVLDSVEQLGPERVTKTNIDFIDFVYSSEFVSSGSSLVHKESFTDKQTQNIRQNERTLEFPSRAKVVEMAQIAGFMMKGAFSLREGPSRDAAQEIVIFERTS
jgi:SAM-dependent methyltransferase